MARHYRRRYYGNRYHLSNKYVYGNRSAKSQAKQIAALRNRINSVYRQTKPEVKVVSSTAQEFELTNSSVLSDSYVVLPLTYPIRGDADYQFHGDEIHLVNVKLSLSMEYHNTSSTGYLVGESAGTPVRIIVVQDNYPTAADGYLTLDELLSYSGYSGAQYTLRATSPFKRGVTEHVKIVYNRLVYMTTDKNQFSTTLNLKGFNNIRWDKNDAVNRIWVYVVPCGLHASAATETVEGAFASEIAFTDA